MAIINGALFDRAMENNCIRIAGKNAQIHSFNQDGSGIYRQSVNSSGTDVDDIRFNLKKSDMGIMAKFKELTVEKDNETLRCTDGSGRFSIQNLVDLHEVNPNLRDVKDIGLPWEDFKKTAGFLGKNSGMTVCSTGVMAYDKNMEMMYKRKIELDAADAYVLPAEILKYTDKEIEYQLKTNRKMLCAMANGEMVYSSVMKGLTSSIPVNYDPQLSGWFEIQNLEELQEHLKFGSSFGTMVFLTIDSGKVLHLRTISGTDDPRSYEAQMKIDTNISRIGIAFQIAGLLKILTLADPDQPVRLYLDNGRMRFDTDNEFAILGGIRTPENVNIVLEEEHDGTE